MLIGELCRVHLNVLGIIICVAFEVMYAADVGGWEQIEQVPINYYRISTPNVLRCGTLCKRQGQCMAATFDKQERICYLHNGIDGSVETQTGGRFLFKKFEDNADNHITNSACETNDHLMLPSARNTDSNCYDMGVNWELILHTSDVWHAGTDSDVYVRLGNDHQQGERFIFIKNEGINDREEGSVDTYTFTNFMSDPTWLEFQLKKAGLGPGWHLQKFILTNKDTGTVYEVEVGAWLHPKTEFTVRRFSLV